MFPGQYWDCVFPAKHAAAARVVPRAHPHAHCHPQVGDSQGASSLLASRQSSSSVVLNSDELFTRNSLFTRRTASQSWASRPAPHGGPTTPSHARQLGPCLLHSCLRPAGEYPGVPPRSRAAADSWAPALAGAVRLPQEYMCTARRRCSSTARSPGPACATALDTSPGQLAATTRDPQTAGRRPSTHHNRASAPPRPRCCTSASRPDHTDRTIPRPFQRRSLKTGTSPHALSLYNSVYTEPVRRVM